MFFLCKRNRNLETLTCKSLLSLLAHVFEEEQLSFYMFFDKSYCNSFVQKKNYLYSRRNMKCLIYKQAGDFSNIVFFENERGSSIFILGSGNFLKI